MGEEGKHLKPFSLAAVILNYLNLKLKPFKPEGGESEYERYRKNLKH